jgi:hypothetical protein
MACTAAAASDPGAQAIRFLEKVRAGKVNLEAGGDTAISPETSAPKRAAIARRLERLTRDLGEGPLEAGAVRIDGDLAAVIVRNQGGFDPSKIRVFPIALVLRGDGWLAAPVPGSFENCGLGYAAPLRQRLDNLGGWLLREQSLDLERSREQATIRMRNAIESRLPAAALRRLDSRQAAERFLRACSDHSLPEILGLLGGLEARPPDDWSQRLEAVTTALAKPGAGGPWRLLLSPDVLRVVVQHEDGQQQATTSVACLDPARASGPRFEMLHLELSKSPAGCWRVDLPGDFIHGATDTDPAPPDEAFDVAWLEALPGALATLHPHRPEPAAEQARDALIQCLQVSPFTAQEPSDRTPPRVTVWPLSPCWPPG